MFSAVRQHRRNASASERQGREPEADATGEALEVTIVWGESEVLRADHVAPARTYTIGDDPERGRETDFLVPAGLLAQAHQPLVVVDDDGTLWVVVPVGAGAELEREGQSRQLPALLESGHAHLSAHAPGAYELRLEGRTTARVTLGELTFFVRAASASKLAGLTSRAPFDLRQQLWTVASFALHALFIGMMYAMPPDASALSIEALSENTRRATYLLQPPTHVEQPVDMPADDAPDDGGRGEPSRDDEGKLGKDTAPVADRKYAVQGPPQNREPRLARAAALREASSAGILGVLAAQKGAWDSPTSLFGAETPMGYDPENAMGNMLGARVGESFGFGGLHMRGTGRGGGGAGEGTIGLGAIATIGHGAGDGSGTGYGRGAGSLGRREARVPAIRAGQPDVRGSLSKEVIRRNIQRHLNEVRFCYERELSALPELEGRVQVKFVIAPSGAVQAAQVESSSLGNARAEECIASALRRWSFPAPDGGGVVIVSYPFLFANRQ